MTDIAQIPASTPETKGRSLFQLATLRFRRNRPAMAGCVMLVLIALFSFVGPLFSPHSYDQVFPSYVTIGPSLEPRPDTSTLQDVMEGVATRARVTLTEFNVDGETFTATVTSDKPIDPRATRYFDRANEFENSKVVATENDGRTLKVEGEVAREYFPFGTDSNGRDLLVRVMLGGQISIAVGLLASLVSLGIGVVYGATSGYIGGRVDNVMMRLVEILYSLPFVFLVVVLVVFFGRSFILIFLVIGAVEWLDMARIVRGQTLALKRREFVGAAQALGLTDWQIIRGTSSRIRSVRSSSSSPSSCRRSSCSRASCRSSDWACRPAYELGCLISEGANNIQSAPWLLIFPAIFFVVTLFSLNFVGDGLRDALDPKDR